MKKSQVLAALALAFALGVVAPVLSTTNTASAFTVADASARVEGKATLTDVKNAVASVRADQTYKNMMNLRDQLNLLADGTYADFEIDGTNHLPVVYNNVWNAIHAINAKALESLPEEKNFVKMIENILPVAENMGSNNEAKTAVYQVMAPIFAAIANRDDAAFVKALQAYNIRFNVSFNTTVENKISDYIYGSTNEVQANFNAIFGAAYGGDPYTAYLNLYNAVEDAKEAKDKYVNGEKALKAAFDAPGVLSVPAGHDHYVVIINQYCDAAGNSTLNNGNNMSLQYLADTAKDAGYMNRYNEWLVVDTKVQGAEKSMMNADNNYNYDLVMQIAQAIKTATLNTMQTPEQIAQSLVGYTGSTESGINTIWSEDKIVSVTGKLDPNTTFVKAKASDKKVAAFGSDKYAMYDIDLVDKDGNKVTFEGSVMVTIKVPNGIEGSKSSIYYVDNDGKVSKITARYENGNMVFTTNHFSLYAIVEDNGKNLAITAPGTGVVAGTDGSASTTVAMVAGVATALTAAGAGVVAYRNARRSTRK